MNKYNIGFSIKLPIPGQDYSNLETRFDWSEETDLPFGDVLERATNQSQLARVRFDKIGSDLQIEYKTLLEEQDARLNKAREEYLKLANKK